VPTPLRAARLAVWGTAFLQGRVGLHAAVDAIEGDDEPHLVVAGPLAAPDELDEALPQLLREGVVGLRLALPAPGDLLGLTGPAEVNQAALDSGEAVIGLLAHQASTVPAWVPDVTPFGPPGDHGHCVTWRAMVASATLPDVPSLREAERALRQEMQAVTDTLQRLGSIPWLRGRETAAGLRARHHDLDLPESAGPRAESVAQLALQVLALTEAARRDDGGALTSHAASSRLATVVPLDRSARRALVAACTAALERVAR
jgi:hypothetical protein